MAFQLALGCEVGGPRTCCDVCPEPTVDLTTVIGTGMRYVIGNADSASITIQCGSSPATTTSITLSGGAADITYNTSGAVCFISVTATNECGTTTKTWRNYTTPRTCDCIIGVEDPPALWGRVGSIILTISGTASPQPLVIGGSTFCASPAACGDVSGSFAGPCLSPSRRYIVTTHTGCSNYHYYLAFRVSFDFLNWNFFSPYYACRVDFDSGWFTAASNPYASLTQVAASGTLNAATGLTLNSRQIRNVNLQFNTSRNYAPGASMLRCYTGTLVGSGGGFANSFDFVSNPGSANRGHCDTSGLTISAEVAG